MYIHTTGKLDVSVLDSDASLLCATSFSVYCAAKVSIPATKTQPSSSIEAGASKHHSSLKHPPFRVKQQKTFCSRYNHNKLPFCVHWFFHYCLLLSAVNQLTLIEEACVGIFSVFFLFLKQELLEDSTGLCIFIGVCSLLISSAGSLADLNDQND